LYLDKRHAPANTTDGHRGHGSCDVEREGKLEIVWSPVDETPIFTLTGGKDAPHPNATKLYLTWFLAREQQSRLVARFNQFERI
jgi:hypothetical protein